MAFIVLITTVVLINAAGSILKIDIIGKSTASGLVYKPPPIYVNPSIIANLPTPTPTPAPIVIKPPIYVNPSIIVKLPTPTPTPTPGPIVIIPPIYINPSIIANLPTPTPTPGPILRLPPGALVPKTYIPPNIIPGNIVPGNTGQAGGDITTVTPLPPDTQIPSPRPGAVGSPASLCLDSMGYIANNDSTLTVDIIRQGGDGMVFYEIDGLRGNIDPAAAGWSNVKGASDSPGQTMEMKISLKIPADNSLAGKYFNIVLKPLSPENTKESVPFMATITIPDLNAPPQQATVSFDADAYSLNKGGSALVTIQRTGGSGVVWVNVVAYPAAADGSPDPNPSMVNCWWMNSYSTAPGDNIQFEVRASQDVKSDDGLVFHLPPAGSTVDTSGDLVYYMDLTPLDSRLAAAGEPWRAKVTLHNGNTTITPITTTAAAKTGSLSSGGSTINQDINTIGGNNGQGDSGQAVELNPQPEPPAPDFITGIVNWFKGLFGMH